MEILFHWDNFIYNDFIDYRTNVGEAVVLSIMCWLIIPRCLGSISAVDTQKSSFLYGHSPLESRRRQTRECYSCEFVYLIVRNRH